MRPRTLKIMIREATRRTYALIVKLPDADSDTFIRMLDVCYAARLVWRGDAALARRMIKCAPRFSQYITVVNKRVEYVDQGKFEKICNDVCEE